MQKNEIKEVTTVELPAVSNQNLPANSPVGMMLAALNQGVSPEQLSQMMDLQERWQAAEAKKAYDEAFAAFKAKGVRILKTRKVDDGPLKGKSYAELHGVVNAVTEALSENGLSTWWRITKDEKDWIEVTCYMRHVGGHEESVSMGGPPDTQGAKNAIQARASTKSYLERYTLKAITGLAEEGDDTDGNVYRESVLHEWLQKVEAAKTMKELVSIKREGTAVFGKARDRGSYQVFSKAVSDRSDKINGA